MEHTVEIYETARGKCPYTEWLESLKDLKGRAKIKVRIDRLEMGNFGHTSSVGECVFELKIDFGPGYRVYYGKIGLTCVLLLCGGTKRTQVSDIKEAKVYFADYKARRD